MLIHVAFGELCPSPQLGIPITEFGAGAAAVRSSLGLVVVSARVSGEKSSWQRAQTATPEGHQKVAVPPAMRGRVLVCVVWWSGAWACLRQRHRRIRSLSR